MSAYAQKVGRKFFRNQLEQHTPPDPVYEHYNDARGRQRRKKREVPPGLSPRDAAILKAVQRRARCLDKSFNLCGIRFGWTFIIGIVPVAGDVVCATLNYVLVVRKAREAELPASLISRMLFNNAISACSGFVPVVGDIIVAVYKANSRNARLLEEFLRVRGEERLKEMQAEKEATMSSASQGELQEQVLQSGVLTNSNKGTVRSWSSFVSQIGKKQTTMTTVHIGGDRGRFIENINS